MFTYLVTIFWGSMSVFLKQIKIVGFKSFVEPTTLYFNHPRVAVVGPNGCGKSNVIDAIRWVMGESSPKFLRGDLMSDVIFNGSVQRKPLGVASVEILLDNQNGLLLGAYVTKGDVALRREINRSGESTYYINGQRVRRKDLTDLWLGTGAGARGYAIIGQNMVNHLVEANPEVLRGYLEEAAGVSKYKERRKESAERLNIVMENLARITDIVFELNGQLERLQKEAGDAELYHQYRKQLREYQEQFELANARQLFKKYQKLQEQASQYLQAERHLSQQVEDDETQLQALEQRLIQSQDNIQKAQQHLHQLQMQCQQSEQQYQQRLKDKAYYLQEHEQLLLDKQQLTTQVESEQLELNQLNQTIQTLQESAHQSHEDLLQHRAQEQSLRMALKEAHQERQNSRYQLQQRKTQFQILQAKQEQASTSIAQLKEQMLLLQKNVRQQNGEQFLEKRQQAEMVLLSLQHQKAEQVENLRIAEKQLILIQAEFQQFKNDLIKWQKDMEATTRATLMAQAAYQGMLDAEIPAQQAERLQDWSLKSAWMQKWSVPEAWQKVVDWLWGHFLPAYLGDQSDWLSVIQQQVSGCFSILETFDEKTGLPLPRLIDFLGADKAPMTWIDFASIYLVENEDALLSYQSQLTRQQMLLTPCGIWAGPKWVCRIPLSEMKSQGLATRLHDVQQTEKVLADKTKDYDVFIAQYGLIEKQYIDARATSEQKKQLMMNLEHELKLAQQQLLVYEQQHALFKQERERVLRDCERFEQQYVQMNGQLKDWQIDSERLQSQIIDDEQLDLVSSERIAELQSKLALLEDKTARFVEHDNQKQHELTKLQTQHSFHKLNLPKLVERLQGISARLTVLDQSPIMQDMQDSEILVLNEQLKQQVVQAEIAFNQIVDISKLELQKKAPLVQSLDTLKKQHMVALEKKWKFESELTQMQQEIERLGDMFSEKIWAHLPAEHGTSYFKALISEYERKLELLGDVNLLAVGLFQQEKTRHSQMLEQEKDLLDAIAELEIAIQTLDNDMQQQLQQTLEQINQQLEVIFPQLFGGGEAKFVASCDNLLEATVTVQVQLPGKKQHRIQLLSGGEKALTAVALLFSIFSLNPAPFCLLDEVDAALDDANVQRLANLIRNMSNTVQFVLITHNPLTMDVAMALVGVTMQEPGVSRVVSVNMETALAMVNKE
ncbi:MAG: chromosome segregation protein SMC [Gammaproteobacteria bacterium]|nr:chromosome segregation protein SMC [Gammaproteobacteria bacterium]